KSAPNTESWFEKTRKKALNSKEPIQYLLDQLYYSERENEKSKENLQLYKTREGELPVILKEDTARKFVTLVRTLILERNHDKLFDNIVNGLHKVFKYDRVGLMLYNENTKKIEGIKSIGLPGPYYKNLHIDPSEISGKKMRNYVARCFSKQKTIFIKKRTDEPLYNIRLNESKKIYSPQYALVPISSKKKIYGVFTIATLADSAVFLTANDIVFMEFFSNQIGIALENSELNSKIEKFYRSLIATFSNMVEFRDESTGGHCARLISYVRLMADKLNFNETAIMEIELAATMHDIGKICTPDAILNKPGKLTPEEYNRIKKHAQRGSEIVSPLSDYKKVLEAIRYHHEKWDGTGYPDGLKGNQIPLHARIISLADAFDVMINNRPYKKAKSIKKARYEVKKCAGSQFDPDLSGLFLTISDNEIIAIQKNYERGKL
ncbi:HD domain-containing protein, partial [bacterium]|nr:HD domain-containing protein [bacterium]